MTIRKEILDELIRDYKNPEDLLGENGLLKQLTKALLERAMNALVTRYCLPPVEFHKVIEGWVFVRGCFCVIRTLNMRISYY